MMRRKFVVLWLLVTALRVSLVPTPARADEPFFDPARFALDNGLEVWVQPRPGTPTVALRLMVRVGSRYETEENNGISHFLEHMVFTGTEKWNEAEVDAIIDRLGGEDNAWTWYEATCYWVDVNRDYAAQAMEWLAQIVAQPNLSADQVEEERQVIIQEAGGELGSVFRLLERLGFGYDVYGAVLATLFPDSTLVLNAIGSEASLGRLSHGDLLEHYRTYYVPDNMVLIVVGDVTLEEVHDLAQTYLGELAPGRTAIGRPARPAPFNGPVVLRLRGPNVDDWGRLSIGYRTTGANHPDRHSLDMVAEVLRFRLNESVRLERGLVYGIEAANQTFTDAGYFEVWTASEGQNLAEIQTLVEAELDRLKAEPISPDDLTRARQRLNGRRAMWLETNAAQADWLVDVALWLPPDQPMPDEFAGTDAVSAADVQRVAQAYFVPENRFTALYRPVITLTKAAVWAGVVLGIIILMVVYRRWRRRKARVQDII